jgi:hypothetical protein
MEDTPVVTGLLEKRAQIETAIAELERQIRVRRLEIAQLDATICMFAPSVIAAKREATKFKRSVHFLTDEQTRLCQDCLRQADGRPVTAREMAVTALHQNLSMLATASCGGLHEADRLDARADDGAWRGDEARVWGFGAVGVA